MGTASRGVTLVRNRAELTQTARELELEAAFEDAILVQEAVTGWLERAPGNIRPGAFGGFPLFNQPLSWTAVDGVSFPKP
jgi:hypothetical protein